MRKAPEAFRTISEVAEILQTPAHVLRFWESKFSHVKPVKRAGGRRYYRPSDVALLAGIRSLLHDQGMTIRGVQKMLTDKGTRHVAGLAPAAVVEVIGGEVDAEQLEGAVIDGEVTLNTPGEAGQNGADGADSPETVQEDDSEVVPPDTAARSDAADVAQAPASEASASDAPTPDFTVTETASAGEESPAVGAPDATEPEAVETGTAEPGATEPGTTESGTTEPGAVQAEGVAPVDNDPGIADTAPDTVPEDTQRQSAALAPRCLSSARTPPKAAPPESEAPLEGASDADTPTATGARIAIRLRAVTPGAVAPHRSALGAAAKRLDALLDRMSDTSGVRRW